MIGLASKLSDGRMIEVYRCADDASVSIRTTIDGKKTGRIRLSDEAMWVILNAFVRIQEHLMDDDKQYDVRYQYREKVSNT